jgi:hypothetical protein
LAAFLKIVPFIGGRQSTRLYVMAIVFIILVPGLILAGLLAMSSARSERAQLEQSAKSKARETTAAIERDVIGTENLLITLAGSPSLQSGDIEAFYGQAADVSRKLGLLITLWDVHLDLQVINAAFPWGTPLFWSTSQTVCRGSHGAGVSWQRIGVFSVGRRSAKPVR